MSSFVSTSLLTASSDELSSSSSDSGAKDFTVGTKCAYFVKNGVLHCLSFVEGMLSLLLNRPLSAPCQCFSDVVVVRYLLLLVLRLF